MAGPCTVAKSTRHQLRKWIPVGIANRSLAAATCQELSIWRTESVARRLRIVYARAEDKTVQFWLGRRSSGPMQRSTRRECDCAGCCELRVKIRSIAEHLRSVSRSTRSNCSAGVLEARRVKHSDSPGWCK